MMSKFKKIVIFSLILSLPINVIGYLWFFKTVDFYEQFDKFNLTISKKDRFYKVGNSVFEQIYQQVSYLFGVTKATDVQLFIKNSALDKLSANLPVSGGEYQKDAILIVDKKVLKGKVKLRGDHMYHWALPSKSWRFKTSKGHIYKGINKLNFILPKTADLLSNHMSYKLAKSLGLLAPDSRLVELSINGVYQGARLMVEQIDESFLRNNRRMPNDIYKGDNIGQKKIMNANVNLFNQSSIWEKASVNNHYDENNRKPLSVMLKNLEEKNHNSMDLNGFANMSILLDITSSYHHDPIHNWMLSYDHYFEKMVPIIWDTTGWMKETVGHKDMNIATAEILQQLFLDYDFLKVKYRRLNDFFNDQQHFKKVLEQEVKQAKKIINNNDHRTLLTGTRIDQQSSSAAIDQFNSHVLNKLDQVKTHFLGDAVESNYRYALIDNNVVRLSISGPQLINGIEIVLATNDDIEKIYLHHKHGHSEIQTDITEVSIVRDGKVIIPIELLANATVKNAHKGTSTVFAEATYDVKIIGLGHEEIKQVSLSFDNFNQQKMNVTKTAYIGQKSFGAQYHNILNIENTVDPVIWEGPKYFSGFTEITDDVVIRPGAQLIFDEGASIRILGHVTAVGTEKNPIIIKAKDSHKPWGAFALKDQAANGSVFKHVIFKGGSGDKGELYEYTAMLSVHNVNNVLIENSEFYDSKLTDDMVHVIYSDVTFKNSKFVRSLSDALDIDISTAVIENCQFINSGNDAVDLMTSDAVVINTTFSNSQDKGISIGEGSRLLAINNTIENNEIGMQSKDTSKAFIYNTAFIGNNKAVDAYHKNWRYSQGGTIYVDKCLMNNNKDNATVGKKSQVVINDCIIDQRDNFNVEDVNKEKITISEDEIIHSDFSLPFFEGYENLIRPQIKGSYDAQ